jgi:hypothetical protein
MKMRVGIAGLLLLGVAACAPAIPNSAPAYGSYQAQREAELTGTATTVPLTPATGFDPSAAAAAIDRAEAGTTTPGAPLVVPGSAQPLPPAGAPLSAVVPLTEAELAANRPRGNAPTNIQVESGEMAVVNGGISDEQDFNAVAGRESIESDRQRIERNRANYVVIEPTAVPERPGDTGPNIVEFALSTSNAVGQQVYSRSAIRVTSPDAACRRYASADLAQEAFLKAGGPERDGRGLDPDGDGFACDWDPTPFRAALN